MTLEENRKRDNEMKRARISFNCETLLLELEIKNGNSDWKLVKTFSVLFPHIDDYGKDHMVSLNLARSILFFSSEGYVFERKIESKMNGDPAMIYLNSDNFGTISRYKKGEDFE